MQSSPPGRCCSVSLPTGGGERSPRLHAHSLSGSTTLLFCDYPRAYSTHFVTNLSPSSNNTAVWRVQVLRRASQFLPPIPGDSAAPSAPTSPSQLHPGQHDCDRLKHTVNFQMNLTKLKMYSVLIYSFSHTLLYGDPSFWPASFSFYPEELLSIFPARQACLRWSLFLLVWESLCVSCAFAR